MRFTGYPQSTNGLTRLEGVIAVGVTAILTAIVLPAFMTRLGDDRGVIPVLVNAKQVHHALAAYAVDYRGWFPKAGLTASESYQALFPTYLSSKELFFARHSAWTPNPPLDHDPDPSTLRPGQNHFAYVPGLRVDSNPDFPLVAEGFVEGRPGVYSNGLKAKGGRMRGQVVIVVRVDGRGRAERPYRSDYRVYDSTGIFSKRDIFAPAVDWLASDQAPLNPAGE